MRGPHFFRRTCKIRTSLVPDKGRARPVTGVSGSYRISRSRCDVSLRVSEVPPFVRSPVRRWSGNRPNNLRSGGSLSLHYLTFSLRLSICGILLICRIHVAERPKKREEKEIRVIASFPNIGISYTMGPGALGIRLFFSFFFLGTVASAAIMNESKLKGHTQKKKRFSNNLHGGLGNVRAKLG